MEEDTISRDERYEYLFHHLVAMFQTLALQQLGKLVNPMTGKLERDLQQAKITIDMLQMIKERTTGNLEQSERVILDRALLELQMNFVDESGKGDDVATEADESEPEDREGEEGEPGRAGRQGHADAADRPDAGSEHEDSETASEKDAGVDGPAHGKRNKRTKRSKRESGTKKSD